MPDGSVRLIVIWKYNVAGICLTALSGSLLYGSWDMLDGSVRLIVIW